MTRLEQLEKARATRLAMETSRRKASDLSTGAAAWIIIRVLWNIGILVWLAVRASEAKSPTVEVLWIIALILWAIHIEVDQMHQSQRKQDV